MSRNEIIRVANLEGKGAVITGAAGGIGSEVVRAFSEAGARVCAVDIKEDALTSLLSTLEGGQHRWEALDLRVLHTHDELLRRTAATFGRLDVLVNAAAVLVRRDDVDEVTEEDWDFQHDLNLKAAFFLNRAAADHARAGTRGTLDQLCISRMVDRRLRGIHCLFRDEGWNRFDVPGLSPHLR